jgi:hypothetical protein
MPNTWIDKQDQTEVDRLIQQMRDSDTGWEYMTYANGDERFALWLRLVDRRIQRMSGGVICLLDLGDFPSRDSYDEGLSPREGVDVLREYDDLFDAFASEQFA